MNEDCSLNGVCTSGACVCDDGWTTGEDSGMPGFAPECGMLDTLPAPSDVSFHGLNPPLTSSWGGSVLRLPVGTDGEMTWAMFAAEMTHNCLLNHWTTNSEVVLATSDSATGPYKEQFQIIPPVRPTRARADR
jgi:hypothetical protein